MKVYDENGSELDESTIDLNLGWIEEKRTKVDHPAVEAVAEQGHWQDVLNNGKVIGQTWIVDVHAVEASEAWTSYDLTGVYHLYTAEQLEANAKRLADENKKTAMSLQVNDVLSMLMASQVSTLSDDQVVSVDAFFPDWTIGNQYHTGDVVRYNNGLWRALQDSTAQDIYPPNSFTSGWKRIGEPDSNGVFPWSQPLGATDAYRTGDKVTYNGETWTTTVDHNVWKPGVYGWVKDDTGSTGTTDTSSTDDEWPEFVQPTGAHDAYKTGDKVTYNGRHYTSLIDANVWTPDAYPQGWEED